LPVKIPLLVAQECDFPFLSLYFALPMKGKKKIFSTIQHGSAVFMIVALLWLTVSIPFVNAAQEQQKAAVERSGGQDRNTNPFSGTNEEKSETGVNMLQEYLHETHTTEHHFIIVSNPFKCHSADLYFAFHPELISPPPEAMAS